MHADFEWGWTHPSAPWLCWNTHLLAQDAALSASVWFQTSAGAECRARKVLCSFRTAERMSEPSVLDGAAAARAVVVDAFETVEELAGLLEETAAALRARDRKKGRRERVWEGQLFFVRLPLEDRAGRTSRWVSHRQPCG